MSKRKNRFQAIDYPLIGSDFDWDLLMLCQSVTKKKLQCPGALNGERDKQSSGGVL